MDRFDAAPGARESVWGPTKLDAPTGDESIAIRSRSAALSPADRAAEVATLLMLPVPEAVATIRAEINADRGEHEWYDVATGRGASSPWM